MQQSVGGGGKGEVVWLDAVEHLSKATVVLILEGSSLVSNT